MGKNANLYLICKQLEKTVFMLLIVLYNEVIMFSNCQEGLSLISSKSTQILHYATSSMKPSRYDSISGTKISKCLKKVGGDEGVY